MTALWTWLGAPLALAGFLVASVAAQDATDPGASYEVEPPPEPPPEPHAGATETFAIPMAAGYRLRTALSRDVNGDGSPDLILAGNRFYTPRERTLRIHLARSEGAPFALEPDHVLDPTPDVVAFAPGDFHPDPGLEICLFTSRGAFAWRPRAPEREQYVPLLPVEFLWQLPTDYDMPEYSAAVVDLDRDGLDDLLIPEPWSYRAAFQRRDETGSRFEVGGVLRVPPEMELGGGYLTTEQGRGLWRGRRDRGRATLSITVGEGSARNFTQLAPLLEVIDQLPAPQCIDWDADGDLDLLAQTSNGLHVWVQDDARFEAEPTITLPLPVQVDRERRFDASYGSHVLDLDGDERADCAIVAGDLASEDVRTHAQLFLQLERGEDAQRALFREDGLPDQLLLLAGFVADVNFDDVDGDGSPDLVARVVRPDLIDQLRTISNRRVASDLYVFFNRGGAFSRRPDLRHRINLPAAELGSEVRFFGDVTGDGVADLLVRTDEERVKIFAVRSPRPHVDADWTVLEAPVFELSVERGSRLVFPAPVEGAPLHFLVVERHQLVYVEFE